MGFRFLNYMWRSENECRELFFKIKLQSAITNNTYTWSSLIYVFAELTSHWPFCIFKVRGIPHQLIHSSGFLGVQQHKGHHHWLFTLARCFCSSCVLNLLSVCHPALESEDCTERYPLPVHTSDNDRDVHGPSPAIFLSCYRTIEVSKKQLELQMKEGSCNSCQTIISSDK